MKKITLMVPASWSDDRIEAVVESYKKAGYEVFIMTVPG